MFKDKILAKLKEKFPGLPNQLLGLLVDKLSPKVTEETQIEGVVNELDNSPIPVKEYADFLQRESDRRVTDAEKEWKKKTTTTNTQTNNDDQKPDDKKDSSDAQLKALSDRLAAFEAKEQKERLQASLTKKLAEKKIPAAFAKGRSVESEDQLETLLTEIETDYLEVKQTMVNEGNTTSLPLGSAGRTDNVEQDILSWATKGTEKK